VKRLLGVPVLGVLGLLAFIALRSPSHAVSLSAEGDRRGATGFVIAAPGHPVRFCQQLPGSVGRAADVEGGPAQDPLDCDGVEVTHVDLDHLTRRKVVDGRIQGEADLEGTFSGGALDVETQSRPRDTRSQPINISHPPCPTPTEGWYQSPSDPQGLIANGEAASRYMASHPEVTDVAIARPGGGSYLFLVLVDGDPAPVRTALLKDFPANALCVVAEPFPRAEITAALTDPDLQAGEAPDISGSGQSITDTGQRVMAVTALFETPAMTAAVARHPAGLVVLHTWLTSR
jgi:hypothetical protein